MGRTWGEEVLSALHKSHTVQYKCEPHMYFKFSSSHVKRSKKKQVGAVLWEDDLALSSKAKRANTM